MLGDSVLEVADAQIDAGKTQGVAGGLGAKIARDGPVVRLLRWLITRFAIGAVDKS